METQLGHPEQTPAIASVVRVMGVHHNMIKLSIIVVPCGHWYLSEASDKDCRGQSYEGDYGLLQEVHFPHQDVRGLSTLRNLLHEIHVHLLPMEPNDIRYQVY